MTSAATVESRSPSRTRLRQVKKLKAKTLGRNGVCSNYSPDTVDYTWACVQGLRPGAKAVFTQAPLPFKCPGAPQKAAYLTADHLSRQGIRDTCDVSFFTHAPVIFGVPFFARELVKVAARHRIHVNYQHNLTAVAGPSKTATFERVSDAHKGERVTVPFDMLHVTPPQMPHDEVRASPLVNAAGWVEVDQNTMQHVKFANVFSLGDVCSTPNSKTAASCRKKSRVSGKNSEKRPVLTWRASSGASEKSVLKVSEPVSEGVIL